MRSLLALVNVRAGMVWWNASPSMLMRTDTQSWRWVRADGTGLTTDNGACTVLLDVITMSLEYRLCLQT